MFIHQRAANVMKFPFTTRQDRVVVEPNAAGTLTDSSTPGPNPMNSDRIYQADDERWYFNVRGNMAKGPYESRADAETALLQHVRQWHRPLASKSWPKVLKVFGEQRRSEPRHS